jgi:EmrB/QacA subfamily drug resistance transporter
MDTTADAPAENPGSEIEAPATGKGTGRSKWIALSFISLGVSMAMIDATIVNVAIPVISADLSLTPTDIEWVNSIYSLVFASLLITMGKLGDVVGRRLMFVLGAAVFLASSTIAARANAGEILIFGRFLQGIGGAMMIPASLSLLNSMFRGKDRAIAFAVWGATIGAVAAAGPLLGGWLTTDFGWRWAFLINIPIATLLIVGTLLLVPESKDPNAKRGFDVVGCLTSAFGFGLLVFGLIEGQRYGWWAPLGSPQIGPWDWNVSAISPVPIAFLLSVILIGTFVLVERRRAEQDKVVLLDLELFKIPTFAWGNLAGALIMFGEFGMLLTIPLFLQNVLGFTAIGAGTTLVFIMLGALVSTPPSGRLVNKFGAIQVVRIGLVLEIVAMIVLGTRFGIETNTWSYAPWLFLFGVGVGLSTAQITNVILRGVPVHKSGQASGTQSTSRQLGTALGVAVLGATLWLSLADGLESKLEQQTDLTATERTEVTRSVVDSTGVVLGPLRADPETAEIARIADEAYAESTARAVWVGAGFMSLGLAGTFLMRRRNEDEPAAEPVSEPVAATAGS